MKIIHKAHIEISISYSGVFLDFIIWATGILVLVPLSQGP